jgi:hypothetical protein
VEFEGGEQFDLFGPPALHLRNCTNLLCGSLRSIRAKPRFLLLDCFLALGRFMPAPRSVNPQEQTTRGTKGHWVVGFSPWLIASQVLLFASLFALL